MYIKIQLAYRVMYVHTRKAFFRELRKFLCLPKKDVVLKNAVLRKTKELWLKHRTFKPTRQASLKRTS